MPSYRIYRLNDLARQHFRLAPHTSGVSVVKRKDYEESGSVEAASPYAAWAESQRTGNPIRVGDILELENTNLRIAKYVGFEEACWVLPEVKAVLDTAQLTDGG